MPRVPPFDRRATFDDLVAVADSLVAEIVDGELHASPAPPSRLASCAIALGGMLLRGLARSAGPESWQVLPTPELHLGADLLVPAVAGWRRSRLPELPGTAYFAVAPDWVCEIPSVGTASLRARRMAIYAGEGVSHAWLIDPVARTLEVRRVEDGGWRDVGTFVGEQIVQAEPFETVELPLAALWPGGANDRRSRRG